MKKIRICYFLDFSVNRIDGPTINEIEFINSLERQSDVDVFYFVNEENRPLINSKKHSSYYFKNPIRRRVVQSILNSLWIFYLFTKNYYKTNPDLIITRLGPMPLTQYLISIFWGRKLYVKTMGRFWNIGSLTHFKDRIYNTFIIFMNSMIMKNSIGIDTVTENFKRIFCDTYKINPKKILVVENSVNTDTFYPFPKVKSIRECNFESMFPILGYVGNLPSQRGAVQLVNLVSTLQSVFPSMAIVIVGDDLELRSIKAHVFQANLKNCFFLGEMPYAEIPNVINLLDVGYSFTTAHDLKEVGNSSQKLRQYIACGKPVITMKDTNNFVVENELGSTVDQDNKDEIAAETVKWVKRIESQGPQLEKRLAQYAKEHLSTKTTFQQRLKFWNKLLKDEACTRR